MRLRGARRKRQKWPKLHEASIFRSSSTCCSAGTLPNVLNDPVWDVKRAAVHLLSELGPLFDDSTTESLNRYSDCTLGYLYGMQSRVRRQRFGLELALLPAKALRTAFSL
ncbi:CDK3 [Symbiodinium sp. KB8]|nr:CDK3 [Symbiodinium sp. KB8]